MKQGIISALSAVAGAAAGAGAVGKVMMEESDRLRAMSDKYLALFQMMNQWVRVKQQGKNLSEYFEKNGYQKIAIYGMGCAGETLADELKETKTEVAYGIDQHAGRIRSGMDIVSMEADLAEVDVVIVTAITYFDEIERKLSEKMECPILSLEDILYEM